MSIREFYLKNKTGSYFDLNDADSFLTDVSGLGFEKSFEFQEVGEFLVAISSHLKQATPKGAIIFSGYAKYMEFMNFILKPPFVLTYLPMYTGNILAPFLDVDIKVCEKSELENGILSVPIEFIALGNYYYEWEYNVVAGSCMATFPLTFPFTFCDGASGTVTIESDSLLKSPCAISILGPCTNPSWAHAVNGVLTTTGKVNCSVLAGERLIVSCYTIPYSIKKFDRSLNEIEDCYQDSDFSTTRFVYIRQGTNTISFLHEGAEDLNVSVNAKFSFASS